MYNLIKKDFIFEKNNLFECCHASTLVLLSNENILAAWFGGSKEGANDVSIWSSKLENGLWSKPVKITDEEGIPHWNPVLFTKKDGTIILYYKVGQKN